MIRITAPQVDAMRYLYLGVCSSLWGVLVFMADFSRFLGRLFAKSYTGGAERYLVALLLPLMALLLTLRIAAAGSSPFFPLFSLAVVIAAAYGGTKPGLVAVAMSALLNAFTIMPPRFSLRIADPDHLIRELIFIVAATAIAIAIGAIGDLQRKLDAERERWRITLTGIGDAVIATDPHGRITFLNPVAESVTGWKRQESIGRPLETVFKIINESTRAAAENPVRKVLQLDRVVGLANHTVLIRKDGGEIPIDDSAAPIIDASGRTVGVVLVFRDISERRLAEAALLRTEKLATVGRMAATIAHEINNPLESVTNLLYLASHQEELSSNTRDYLSLAQRELGRAAHVSKQTLSFARGHDTAELVDIRGLADSVLDLYAHRLEQREISLHKRYGNSGSALATSSEVRQVIANLVGNALDALPAGGALHVRVREVDVGSQRMVRVTVTDNGHGIERQNLGRIFEPFFTTKENVGTGLGLWISQQIVERHGGFIRVRSRVGKGTVFAAYWPLGEPLAAVAGAGARGRFTTGRTQAAS